MPRPWTFALLAAASLAGGARGLAECPGWSYAGTAGKVAKKRADEVSGLVASRQLQSVLWVHNDQPGDERVFGLSTSGELLAQLDVQVDSLDWEDIAVGPCWVPGQQCLYLADTGGSERKRKAVQILRFLEPRFQPNTERRFRASMTRFEVALFHYADGRRRDVEALMVDTAGNVWLIDKDKQGASLFRAKFERGTQPGATLQRVATRSDIGFVTGADLSPSGDRFVVRNLEYAYEFRIARGQDVAAAFADSYTRFRLQSERQGEAIGYSANGLELFTTSEGKREPIHRYRKVSCGSGK